MNAQILVGCSGFRYLQWRGHFYPSDADSRRMLEVYASHFTTLEIKETYYGLFVPSTLKGWVDGIPEGFSFSLKVPRFVVLAAPGTEMELRWNRFLQSMEPLLARSALAALLVQVPTYLEGDHERLRAWLDIFRGNEWDLAFDFKHPSWREKAVFDLLAEAGADAAAVSRPGEPPCLEVPGRCKYFRLTGVKKERNYDYSFKEITLWHERILAAGEKAERIYVYFNNPERGNAPVNAKTLLKMASDGPG